MFLLIIFFLLIVSYILPILVKWFAYIIVSGAWGNFFFTQLGKANNDNSFEKDQMSLFTKIEFVVGFDGYNKCNLLLIIFTRFLMTLQIVET